MLFGYLSCVLDYFGLKACLQMLGIEDTVGLTGLICVLVGLGFIVWHLDVGLSFGYFGLSLGKMRCQCCKDVIWMMLYSSTRFGKIALKTAIYRHLVIFHL